MRISYDEKISKINDDRKLILNIVKENLNKNKLYLSENLDSIINTLSFDEQNTREYKTIINAKQLIFSLTKEISTATTAEEVINLRKKLNYYINKIKKEILKRNVSQELFDKMYNSVSYLRNSISMYLRFLKRGDIVKEIINLFENINDLSDEANIRFKKILANELKYNKRTLKNIDDNLNKNKKNVEKKEIETERNKVNKEENDLILQEKTQQRNLETPLNFMDIPEIKHLNPEKCQNPFLNENFLAERLKFYNSQYHFVKLFAYDSNFFENFVNFFRNISKYNRNQRIIKSIERDYNIFYHGQDLKCFIDYSKRRNSIITALAIIFKSSHLSKREIECLNNHEKCQQWIIEFHSQQDYKYDSDICLAKVK